MWTSLSSKDNLINEMFKVALQLEEPWKLMHVEYDDKEEAWHLFIDFERGSTFACPVCGAESKAYDAEVKKWRHLGLELENVYACASAANQLRFVQESYAGAGQMVQAAVALYAALRSVGDAADGGNAGERRGAGTTRA